MRATLLLGLLGLLVAGAIAHKGNGAKGGGHGKGNRHGNNDNDNDHKGKSGKGGGKDGQKCDNCIEIKATLRAMPGQSKEIRQTIREMRRNSMEGAKNDRTRAIMAARGDFRAQRAEFEQARLDAHAEANTTRQAELAAAHQGFSGSISSIESKVADAEQVLEQYADVEAVAVYAAEVGALEKEALEQKQAIQANADALRDALPACPQIEVLQGQCTGCASEAESCGPVTNNTFCSSTSPRTGVCSFQAAIVPHISYSSKPNKINFREGLGCCDGLWLCNGSPHPLFPDNPIHINWAEKYVGMPSGNVTYEDDEDCEAERLANATEIQEDADEAMDLVDEQLKNNRSLARQKLDEALEAEFVKENEDGMVYEATCNRTVEVLRAEKAYLMVIAAADQEYYDALVQPRKERRTSVKEARQEFRNKEKEIRQEHKRLMKEERMRFRQQRRQGKIWKEAVCQKNCPDFPPGYFVEDDLE